MNGLCCMCTNHNDVHKSEVDPPPPRVVNLKSEQMMSYYYLKHDRTGK